MDDFDIAEDQGRSSQVPAGVDSAIPQWDNYRQALTGANHSRYFMNTMFYAISVMVAEAVSCSFIAYGFARLRAPGKNALFVLVLATMMLPGWVTLIPQYIMSPRSAGSIRTSR